jgi:hypothetical protein
MQLLSENLASGVSANCLKQMVILWRANRLPRQFTFTSGAEPILGYPAKAGGPTDASFWTDHIRGLRTYASQIRCNLEWSNLGISSQKT